MFKAARPPVMSTPSTTLPSGVSPPLTANSGNNHSGLIVVITAFYLVLVLSSLVARVFSSYHRHIIQQDDYLFGALVVAAVIQAAVVLVQVHYGWGTRTESVTAADDLMLKAGYAADILSIIVLGFSKITTSIFYETVFSHMHRRLFLASLIAVIAWTFLAVLLLAVRCSHDPWHDISTAQCRGLLPRWQAITAIDIVTEVGLFLYSGLAIHRVRISTKQKLVVFFALESRILLIPLAVLRLYFTTIQITSNYPTLTGAFATVTTEMYLALSVVCLVTAFLKSLLAAYEDNQGISYTEGASRSGSKSMKVGATNPFSNNFLSHTSHTSTTVGLSGWEREEDPIIDAADAGQGWQIFKTVQLSVQDESIELTGHGTANS